VYQISSKSDDKWLN
jgi:hypothetical protein